MRTSFCARRVCFLYCLEIALLLLIASRGGAAVAPKLASPSREATGQKTQVALAAAREAIGRDDYALAIKILENSLFEQPGQVDALSDLAYCYSQVDRTGDAVDLYRQVLELDPKRIESRYNLGVLLLKMEKHAEAANEFKRVLELDPNHKQARLLRASALLRTGKKDQALEQFLQLASRDPKALEPRRAALALLLEKKDWQRADTLLGELHKLDPTNSEWLLTRAEILANLQRREEALAAYEKYFETADSSTPPAELGEMHMRAGWLYWDVEKPDKALEHFAAAGRAGGEAYAWASAHAQARTLFSQKRYAEAVPFYRRALELQADDVDVETLADYGYALLQTGQYAESARVLAAVVQNDPKRVEAYNHLASALFLGENYRGTVRALELRAGVGEETLGTLFLRAASHDKLGECLKAMEYYDKFLARNPATDSDQYFQATSRLRGLKKTCREKR